MTRIAILGSGNLLGQEVRNLLGQRRELWQSIDLLASSEEEVGTVSEAGGAAKLVTEADAAALEGIDLLFACGPVADDLTVVERRPAGSTAILLSPGAGPEHGRPVIAGLGAGPDEPGRPEPGQVLVSPHPAAIALGHLLAPLTRPGAGLAAERAAATVLQPASVFGSRGLDDLLDQTRDLLTMTGERRESVFERQLAFNLYPAPHTEPGVAARSLPGPGPAARCVAELVRTAAGVDLPLAVQVLQGPVFHGVACSLFVAFAEDPGAERVLEALAEGAHVGFGGPGEEVPGAIDAAAREDILVGSVQADATVAGGYWVWAVMDNLTRGGALNAVEIAETVLRR